MTVRIRIGDCRDVLATLAEASIDSVVTDPPYGIGFMGKQWDTPGSFVERKPNRANRFDKIGGNHNPTNSADASRTRRIEGVKFQAWCEEWAAEVFRVLKPGGYLLAFGGTRTYHRLVCAIEDAGFEIRDQIGWAYGSGFPKSLDVSKAIDNAAGAEREVIGPSARHVSGKPNQRTAGLAGSSTFAETIGMGSTITAPATPEAAAWQGWGTALKPAWEPICVARKPLIGTVAANVLAHGTGAINIDGCRVGMGDEYDPEKVQRQQSNRQTWEGGSASGFKADHEQATYNAAGRWPANLVHDGSDEVLAAFPQASGAVAPVTGKEPSGTGFTGDIYGKMNGTRPPSDRRDGGGSAARFFYCAKATKAERGEGNDHPTVKPVALMRWLVRLVTPPGGMVLDPFAGSGTTGLAASIEQFNATLIELDPAHAATARRRIDTEGGMFS